MIDKLSLTDLNGLTFHFTIGENPPTPYFPVQSWDTTIDYRYTLNEKTQAHGMWPAPEYMGKCTITIEGAVFGDDYANYVTNYKALKYAAAAKPNIRVRDNSGIGTLHVKPTGDNTLDAVVGVSAFTCKQDGNTYSPWQLILFSFDPYFIDRVSGGAVFF